MDRPATYPPLIGMLRDIAEAVGDRERVLLGELIDALGTRGFGPVIVMASAMTLLPTGIVPGVPAFMGVIMILAGGQMLFGRDALWLPPRVYGIQLPGQALRNGLARAAPVAERIGHRLKPRWGFLARGRLSLWLIAVILISTSLLIVTVGAIPGLPFLLSFHLLAFGLGLTAGDGVIVAAGYAIFAPAAWGAAWFAGLV